MVVLLKPEKAEAAEKDAEADFSGGDIDRLFATTLARGLQVLEAFSSKPEPMSLSELAEASGLNKSAVQRLAHTLIKLGYLERRRGGVVPGRRVLDRAYDYLRSSPLIRRSVPVLANLRQRFNERVDVSLFDDLTIMYVSRMNGRPEMSHAHLVGRRLPTYCTAGGRAVLSHLSAEHAIDILARSDRQRLTPRTMTDIEGIMRQIEIAREVGYALAVEELLLGDISLAAAILDKSGQPVGAVHLGAKLEDWETEKFTQTAGPLAIAAARELSGD